MKWPLAGVAAWYACGVLLGAALPLPLSVLLTGLLLTGVVALPGWRLAPFAFCACLVLAGWSNLLLRTQPLAPDDLRHQIGPGDELATVRGTLVWSPEVRIHPRAGRTWTNVLAVVACREIDRPGVGTQGVAASGWVLASTPFPPGKAFSAGAEVEISGVLRRPRGPLAPGLFDYAAYLGWRGIAFELRSSEPEDWGLAPGSGPPPRAWTDRFQDWAMPVLARGLSPEEEEVRLLWAMTLGWKTALTDEVEEPFQRSGTLHVFAISGLHIALIAAIAGQVLRLLLVPRPIAGILIIAGAWLYTLATGTQPSAVRATLMTTFVVGGWVLARPLNVLNSLAGAAVAVLVWDPRQLFQAGFQLSFVVVGAIGLLATPWRVRLVDPWRPDPLLPAQLVPRWRRWLLAAWTGFAANFAVAAASWAGSLTLAATHFHLFTPASLIANLVVVPLSSLALASSVASLSCGDWAPALGELFNHSAWLWMRAMIAVSRWAAELPGGCWHVATPPVCLSVLWGLLLLATGAGWWSAPRSRTWTLLVAFALALGAGAELWARHAPLRLVVLPLAGGHAVWVRHAHGQALIDTGDTSAVETTVMPFLRAQGVNRLDQLLLTHGDIRHVGGATNLAVRFRPREILASGLKFRSVAYRQALATLRGTQEAGPSGMVAGGRRQPWEILHPAAGDQFARADDGCLVLRLDQAGTRILLLGDLDRSGQARLLDRGGDLSAEVLVVGPPATGAALHEELLARIGPRYLVVADSADPAMARARPAFRDCLARGPWQVFYTGETGALDLRWRDGKWTVLDARGRQLRTNPGSFPVTR